MMYQSNKVLTINAIIPSITPNSLSLISYTVKLYTIKWQRGKNHLHRTSASGDYSSGGRSQSNSNPG